MHRSVFIFLFGSFLLYLAHAQHDTIWNTLTTKWVPPNLANNDPSVGFFNQPLTATEATTNGWTKIENSDSSMKYKGDRYILGDNYTTILIYSSSTGRLVGVQNQFASDEITSSEWKGWFDNEPLFSVDQRGGASYYAFTAYTVDPDTIGTDSESTCDKPAGCGLWFQQRSDSPDSSGKMWAIPKTVAELNSINQDKMWTRAKCVAAMGTHYLWNLRKNMSCKEMRPFFIIYIDSCLSGYGVQTMYHFNTDRLESPPRDGSGVFFYTVPDCLDGMYDDVGGTSTLHMFFNTDPKNRQCTEEDNNQFA